MAPKADDLLLVLSQKEASMLRNIIGAEKDHEPPFGKVRIIQIVVAILLVAVCVILGMAHPELARELIESVMLLIL